MYVRDAKKKEEVWLLDWIDEFGLDDRSVRSRDYVVAVDEEHNTKAGFGRLQVHEDGDTRCCEVTNIGVLPAWREQGVGAHVLERLVSYAGDERFEQVYALTTQGSYLTQFGFRRTDPETAPESLRTQLETAERQTMPFVLSVDRFRMPERLRERFKTAQSHPDEPAESIEEGPEDFGIDPDQVTYKYDV